MAEIGMKGRPGPFKRKKVDYRMMLKFYNKKVTKKSIGASLDKQFGTSVRLTRRFNGVY